MATEQEYREGVEDKVRGYSPLDIEECLGITTTGLNPENAKKVLGDVILCEIIDENEHNEIMRDGIWINQDMGTKTWRTAKVLKRGRFCLDIEVGDIVVYPSDKGIKIMSANKKKYIFLNESKIFYII